MKIQGFGKEIDNENKFSYYGILLTKEEADYVINKKAVIYTVDGHTLFDVKRKGDNFTGEKLIYIVFIDKNTVEI